MTESYIIPEFDENGNFLSDDVKARIAEMIESHIIPEFDENGNILRDDVKERIVEMIKAHAPTPAPSNPGPKVITLPEGHPDLEGTLAEPLPDDLPVGSYLVNEPRFMGYRLSQKTPLGWDIKDFRSEAQYTIPADTPGALRAVVKRGNNPIEEVNFYGTVISMADSLRISFSIYSTGLAKGEIVSVFLEGPTYDLAGSTAVSHEIDQSGAEGPKGASHFLEVFNASDTVEGEYVRGLKFHILVGHDQNALTIDATFGLTSTPDVRASDRTYVPPSERKEITIPDPTYTSNETYTMSTLTIPDVEGVVWHSTHLGYGPTDDIVEPGEHQIDNSVHEELILQAVPERGYYAVNGEDYLGTSRWRWGRYWYFRPGIRITVPAPTGVEATTQGNRSGWIMRFPDVPNARYFLTDGWDESGQEVKLVLSGDVFIAYDEPLYAEADMPYYVANPFVGYVQPDGTVSTAAEL